MRARRKTCGVGINDSSEKVIESEFVYVNDKKVWKIVWRCPFYVAWCSMLKRCYSVKYHNKKPTYKNCMVCDEWLYFSNFKKWMVAQDWENKHLDKDLLSNGNCIYSPENCVFVESRVNNFVLERGFDRGKFLIGVSWCERNKKFVSRCGGGKNLVNLGYYDNEIDAHRAWLAEKLRQAKVLAAEQSDPRVAKAIIDRYENYKIN